MDYGRLFKVAESVRSGQRLPAEDTRFIRQEIPLDLPTFPQMKPPKSIRHPGGFSVSGAPVGTFIRGALLLAGQKAFGRRYVGSDFYQRVESDLALRVMRSHFHGDAPKGAFCCKQCTLAVLPVLEANAIRYFDCRRLANDVRRIINEGEWRFATPANAKMLQWSLQT